MNRIDESTWPVKEPSVTFAEVTVDRLMHGHLVSVHPKPPQHRLAWLLIAALLISGVALGVALQERRRPTSFVKSVPSVLASSTFPKPELGAIPTPPVTLTPPKSSHLPTPRKTVRRSPKSAPPVIAPSASTGTRPAPKVPPCGCERGFGDYICDCL